MADTGDSKSLAGNRVGVRLPSPALPTLSYFPLGHRADINAPAKMHANPNPAKQ